MKPWLAFEWQKWWRGKGCQSRLYIGIGSRRVGGRSSPLLVIIAGGCGLISESLVDLILRALTVSISSEVDTLLLF